MNKRAVHKRVRDTVLRDWWWTACPRWTGDIDGKPPANLSASDSWQRVTCKLCLRKRAQKR